MWNNWGEEYSEIRPDLEASSGRPERPEGKDAPPRRIVADRRTHRARPLDETESGMTVVIEEKGDKR